MTGWARRAGAVALNAGQPAIVPVGEHVTSSARISATRDSMLRLGVAGRGPGPSLRHRYRALSLLTGGTLAADRFNEDEAAEIFARAAEVETSGRQPASGSGGMTLAELQEIGREAGLSPEAVAQAAASIRSAGTPVPAPTFLRIPVGVARTVSLDRPLSDEEWAGLVAELRSTFNASGHVRSDGSFREWWNGNLRIQAGPTPAGYQVAMRTSRGSARSLMTAGGVMAGIGVVGLIAGTFSPAMAVGDVVSLATIGAGLFGAGVLQIPAWARRRREQFARIAERLKAAVHS